MTKRLEVLQKSLTKKENHFTDQLDNHIATVKQANGQPLNDKRNGRATLNKWDRQNNALRNSQAEIEKTKRAIEIEAGKIANVEHAKESFPKEILTMVESGELIQWRKHPNYFFVPGVERVRIAWDPKKKQVSHKYFYQVTDQEQRNKFVRVWNPLCLTLNCPVN